MRQAFDHLVFRLISDIPQHPLELQDYSLWHKDVAGRKHTGGNAPLGRIVAQVKARKDVGVNGAHASPPSSSQGRHASRHRDPRTVVIENGGPVFDARRSVSLDQLESRPTTRHIELDL